MKQIGFMAPVLNAEAPSLPGTTLRQSALPSTGIPSRKGDQICGGT